MIARSFRHVGVLIGALAISAVTLVGCSTSAPERTDSAPTTTRYPSYAPQIKAHPAPTALPGNIITGN